jgi:cell division protein ZapA (FtsZ GTPase activity inhibitor)
LLYGRDENTLAKNKIKLNICGCNCAVTSDDSESYIRSVGDEVQKAMTDIMKKDERISVTLAAVITALSYCDDSHKASDAADNLRSQIKDYLEDSSRARIETEEAKREIERLKREIKTLRSRMENDADGTISANAEKNPPLEQASVNRPQTGNFSHISPDEEKSGEDGFMSFFEKKDNEP